jgi:hypothetical protein
VLQSGEANGKLVYPDTSASSPATSSVKPQPAPPCTVPLPDGERSEADPFPADSDDGSQDLSLGDISVSDSEVDISSGVPSLFRYFVFDAQSSDSASCDHQSQQGSAILDNYNDSDSSSLSSSEADEVERWDDWRWE